MKTTIDLPEDLVTDVKIRAAKDRCTMKEVTAEALRNWLDVRKEGIASTTASEPTLSPEKKNVWKPSGSIGPTCKKIHPRKNEGPL